MVALSLPSSLVESHVVCVRPPAVITYEGARMSSIGGGDGGLTVVIECLFRGSHELPEMSIVHGYRFQTKLIPGEILSHDFELTFALIEVGAHAEGVFETIILYVGHVIFHQSTYGYV